MLTRRSVVLLAAVTVAGLAATGCSEQSAAIRVDDVTVSRADFEDELDLFYENDDLRTFVFGQFAQEDLRGELGTDQSYTQEYVGAVASLRVQFIVTDALLEDEGLAVTDEARAEAEDAIATQVPGGLASVPDDYRDAFLDDVATFNVLQRELDQQAFSAAVGGALADADISVSSRYGSWDPDRLTVVPPQGTSAEGGDDAGEQPLPDDPGVG